MKKINKVLILLVTSVFTLVFTYAQPVPEISEESNNDLNLKVTEEFYATGWMGDGKYDKKFIQLNESYETDSFTKPSCIKISYSFGQEGWGGFYWQNEPDNWGERPGIDLSNHGFKRVTFKARGERGGEIVRFLIGGINDPNLPHRDSFKKTKRVRLENDWKLYSIKVEKENLSSVIGIFGWVARDTANTDAITIYIDDIRYE